THLGDNPDADLRAARRHGIAAELCIFTQPTRYEREVYALPAGSRLDRSLLTGAMRAARVSRFQPDAHQSTVWDVSTNVAGPLLLAHVHWLRDEARRSGPRRLSFVPREGQIPLRPARLLACRRPEYAGLDLRYLYGSRAAWHLPAAARDAAGLP